MTIEIGKKQQTIAMALKLERLSQGVSQTVLVKKLRITKQRLIDVESGRITPSIEFVEKVAKALSNHPKQYKMISQKLIKHLVKDEKWLQEREKDMEWLRKKCGPITIGNLLRSIRKADRINQDAMAKKLNITKKRLSDIENERIIPPLEFVEKTAKKLGHHPLSFRKILKEQLERLKPKSLLEVPIPGPQYLDFLIHQKLL